MLKLATRVGALKSSSILDIAAKAQEMKARGLDVVSLAAGEPDFNTPDEIQKAATQAMKEGITRYTPSQGFLKVRETLAAKISKENGFEVSPEEMILTSGAKHAIYLALQCLLNPGEAVLVPTPGWVSYGSMIELAGGTLIPLPLFEEDNFQVNLERWKGLAIPKNAKGILLNSPNNPTGTVYQKKDLIKLVGWAMQRDLWILSDEIYEKVIYDGGTHTSIASLGPEVKSHTVTISGFSKTYAMTGWRFGWGIGDRELVKKMTALQSQSTSNVTSFVQWAGLAAAALPPSVVTDMVAVFDKRRRLVASRLDQLKGYASYTMPQGAFYFFVNFSPFLEERGITDVQFCQDMLEKHYLALVPGISFGKEKYVRISYANSEQNLNKAFDRIEQYIKG